MRDNTFEDCDAQCIAGRYQNGWQPPLKHQHGRCCSRLTLRGLHRFHDRLVLNALVEAAQNVGDRRGGRLNLRSYPFACLAEGDVE